MSEWIEYNELVDRIQELIDLGLLEDALLLLKEYRPGYSDNWELPFLHSRILMEQNKPHGAIPHLKEALRLDPRNPDCLLGLFYAYSQIDRLPQAARHLLRAQRYHPDSDIVLAALIWYYTETNRPHDARSMWEKARSLSSSNPDIYRNGAIAFQQLGDFDKAEECFRTALELSPNFDEVRDMLTDQYLSQGEFDRAIGEYRAYLKSSPKNIRVLSRLVFCYSQAEQYDEAEKVAKEITELYPNSTVGWVDLSYVNLNRDNTGQALALADRAVLLAPEDSEAHRARAIALSEMTRNADATTAFEKALSIEPHNVEIMRDFYNHLRSAQEFPRMEGLVHRVIRMEQPYCIEDWWFLADHYREQGEDSKALSYLHKAYRSMPGERGLLPPMASILLDRGHTRFALPFLLSYVQHGGWDETMNEFSRHRRLRSHHAQEGIRLIRFLGEHQADFRETIFSLNVRRYIRYAAIGLFPLLATVFYLSFHFTGIIFLATLYMAAAGGYWATRWFAKVADAMPQPVPPAPEATPAVIGPAIAQSQNPPEKK